MVLTQRLRPATDLPLPGTKSFIQSRGWTGCWLFGYWESKPHRFLFLCHTAMWQCLAALLGSKDSSRGAPCVLQHSTAPWGLHSLRHHTGSVYHSLEVVLPKGVPKSLCASQTSLWACSEGSKWGKGWCIISFPSQTSYYCFGQFIPLRMHKANKPCSP